ncbi:MAG: hypothetical protein ACREUN_10225 [Burkholderiales bacterium]
MYDHIGLRVKDVEVSKRFYRATLEALGLVQDPSAAAFGPPGAPALWLHEKQKQDKAGLRTDYSPCYFAAFLVDPDGNNVEAVCLE